MAGIPASLLAQTVTIVRPAVTIDAYGSQQYDYGVAATRTAAAAWLQQGAAGSTGASEPLEDGRDPLVGTWLMMTNTDDVQGHDQIEWTGPVAAVVFEVIGPPEPAYTPVGYHHTETTLRVVTG